MPSGCIRTPTSIVSEGSPRLTLSQIWTFAGVAYGCVELIRRVIPADIVGGNVNKLRRMDATVHVLYEVAGTSGAFASSAAIQRFGNNYSFMLSPIFFVIAGLLWTRVSAMNLKHDERDVDEPALAAVEGKSRWTRNYLYAIAYGAWLFVKSIGFGAWIVLTHRRFVWLFPGELGQEARAINSRMRRWSADI